MFNKGNDYQTPRVELGSAFPEYCLAQSPGSTEGWEEEDWTIG